MAPSAIQLQLRDNGWTGTFHAMASPCEILLDLTDPALAQKLVTLAAQETWRIEYKLSRYRPDNIISRINSSRGRPVRVDAETAQLLNFAEQCYQMSGGLFDVTSGVLRQAWKFDGSDNIPAAEHIATLLPLIGWEKIKWRNNTITLQPGMEIDLGGIGKEYAVDRSYLLLREKTTAPFLINYGGDIMCSGPLVGGSPWRVGIESPHHEKSAERHLELACGALATSGDARKFLYKDGQRYSHILNPETGWSVPDAPRSVTVAADTCTEAGVCSTLAMLHGAKAEEFLSEQELKFWVQR